MGIRDNKNRDKGIGIKRYSTFSNLVKICSFKDYILNYNKKRDNYYF